MDEHKNIVAFLKENSRGVDGQIFCFATLIAAICLFLIFFKITSYGVSVSSEKRLVALLFSPVINFFLLIRLKQLPWSKSSWSAVFRGLIVVSITLFLATI